MNTAKIFNTNEGQTIRLPVELRLDGNEVFVKKAGRNILFSRKTTDGKLSCAVRINSVLFLSTSFRAGKYLSHSFTAPPKLLPITGGVRNCQS